MALHVSISGTVDGSVKVVILLAHPQGTFRVSPATIAASIWAENDDQIRLSLQHRATRTRAYLQGNRSLRTLCSDLQLTVVKDEPAEPAR